LAQWKSIRRLIKRTNRRAGGETLAVEVRPAPSGASACLASGTPIWACPAQLDHYLTIIAI
jgi:hypothetical protein